MANLLRKFLAGVIDHRWAAVLLIVFISVVSGLGHYDETILSNLFESNRTALSSNKEQSPPKRSKASRSSSGVNPIRIDRSDAAIVVTSDNFFTPSNAQAIRNVVAELENLDQVARILWMERMPSLNIFGLGQPVLPRSKAQPAVFDAARQKALAHPLIGGQLLSPDGRTLLLLITYDWRYNLTNSHATTELKGTAQQAAAMIPGSDLTFSITGRVPGQIAAMAHHESNALKFQLIGYGLSLLLAIILFRGIRAVIVVTIAPVIGVLWTLGMIKYLDYGQNGLVTVVVPVLVSLVALTDSVHLMVQTRRLRASGINEKEAAKQAVKNVGVACFLTSLTTGVGFGSLILADSEVVQQFGKSAMIGVSLSFISVVTLIPLLCSSWLGRKIHLGHHHSLVDRNLSKISPLIDGVMKRASLFSVLGILATLVLVLISLTLKPDFRLSNNLPKESEVLTSMKQLDSAFRGIEFVDVRVAWSEAISSDSGEVLTVVSKVDQLLKTESKVGTSLSIVNLLAALPGSGPPEERMSLLELLPPPLKLAFYQSERRTAKVQFRVQDLGIAAYGPVFERLESGFADLQKMHPEFQVELKGNAVWRWKNIFQIVEDLFKSLGVASVIIFLILTAVYRSVRIGLISLVPNLFPLAVAGAFLALAGYNLEIVMVCNFTVCLGIAVDDTIHFLTRYHQEREHTPEKTEAIRNAFSGVGTALIMTTLVLIAGFSGVLFSDSRDHQIFAIMGVLTIGNALFADMIFLPALLKKFDRNERH